MGISPMGNSSRFSPRKASCSGVAPPNPNELYKVHAGSFRASIIHRNSDLDYRIFNVQYVSFLCVRVHTQGGPDLAFVVRWTL